MEFWIPLVVALALIMVFLLPAGASTMVSNTGSSRTVGDPNGVSQASSGLLSSMALASVVSSLIPPTPSLTELNLATLYAALSTSIKNVIQKLFSSIAYRLFATKNFDDDLFTIS